MSEQRTVGSLTADDLGSRVEIGWLQGELVEVQGGLTRVRVLLRVQPARGHLEYRSLAASTPCTVTPGGPQ